MEAEIDEGKKLEGISEAFTRALGSLRNAGDFAVAFRVSDSPYGQLRRTTAGVANVRRIGSLATATVTFFSIADKYLKSQQFF